MSEIIVQPLSGDYPLRHDLRPDRRCRQPKELNSEFVNRSKEHRVKPDRFWHLPEVGRALIV